MGPISQSEGRTGKESRLSRLSQRDATFSARLALPETDPRRRWTVRLAHLGDGNLVLGLLALGYLLGWLFALPQLRFGIAETLTSVLLTAVVITSIKYVVRRQRPRDPTGFVSFSYDKYSFPSGHSGRMSSFAVSIFYFWPLPGLVLLTLALLVAMARVAVRVHYLFDVGVGLLVGGGVAVVVHLISLTWFV